MNYIENPKTKGSGIICCIPQTGLCPNKCDDCFFQSGRSYLEPLSENLPNMPPLEMTEGRVVRVNDGNDSGHQIELVRVTTFKYENKFYNTALPNAVYRLGLYGESPVVLTVNPAKMTDKDFYKLDPIPKNLMFVRFRANTWNISNLSKAIDYYTERDVPLVVTFMAYHNIDTIPSNHEHHYEYKKRVLNSYWVIKTPMWNIIMNKYSKNKLVDSCGKPGGSSCKYCGNCLKYYFSCCEKMREGTL